MLSLLTELHSLLVSILRLGRGSRVTHVPGKQPQKWLELYEFEVCPFCRKVREVLSELDLEYICRPCAKGDKRNRSIVKEKGGIAMFPYLIDPNTDLESYESEDIITYLLETYSSGRVWYSKILSPFNSIAASLSSMIRPYGMLVAKHLRNRPPLPQLLELYSYEASPTCRRVRETLNELNLDYLVRNVAVNSARRSQLQEVAGKVAIPYLLDPNTDTKLGGASNIISHLKQHYG